MDKATRWLVLKELQTQYAEFVDFLDDVLVNLLHYGRATRVQRDIAKTLQYEPTPYLLIEAQRGEAKTTITAAHAIWSLIQDPTLRVLVISAAGDMANQVASLMFRILFGMEVLECMRPSGDFMNASAKNFDIHHDLKGIDKSPSVVAKGADSNIQGFRADLLIGDDIESSKNSKTVMAREALVDIIDEFTSICSAGKIILLGTPQSADSVYNLLPAKGCTVRIWPGRYPTASQVSNYGDLLAPMLREDIESDPSLQTGGGINGDQGKVTDPIMFGEEAHQRKELQQTTAKYQLQFMLNTSLMDKNKKVINIEDAMFINVSPDKTYSDYMFGKGQGNSIIPDKNSTLFGKKVYRPMECIANPLLNYQGKRMDVDPAGGGANGDEVGLAVTYFCNGFVYVPYCSGLPGGYDDATLNKIIDVAEEYKVTVINVEKNFGNGMFTSLLQAVATKRGSKIAIEEVYHTGNKEARMCDTLEPLFKGHKILFDENMLLKDAESIKRYPLTERKTYSLWHQLTQLCNEKGCMKHDDRIDALTMGCTYWASRMNIDSAKVSELISKQQFAKWKENPLGYDRTELAQTSRYTSAVRGIRSKFTV